MNVKLRLRLRFAAPPPIANRSGEKCFMFLINKENCFNVFDVKKEICKQFGFSTPQKLSLLVHGFALMSNDDVDVFRDDEELIVVYCDDLDETVCNVTKTEENLLLKNDLLSHPLTHEEPTDKTNVEIDIASETEIKNGKVFDSMCTDQVLDSNKVQVSENQKTAKYKKKKRKADKTPEKNLNVSIEHFSPESSNILTKSPKAEESSQCKKHKHKKRKRDKSESALLKSPAKNMSQLFSLSDSCENIGISKSDVSNTKRKHKKKRKVDPDSKVDLVSFVDTNIELQDTSKNMTSSSEPNNIKDKKKKKNKVAKINNLSNEESISGNNLITRTPIVADYKMNSITSSLPTSSENHECEINMENKKTFSTNFQHSSNGCNYIEVFNVSKKKSFSQCTDYERLTDLSWPPRVGDTIAFKTMTMGDDYTPFVTEFLEASVLGITDTSLQLEFLHLCPSLKQHKGGRFDMDSEGSEPEEEIQSFAWKNLINPKLVR